MGALVASDLKKHNRKVVYDLFRSEGDISRAELSRRCGISAPTVIKIVDYYEALGLLKDGGEGTSALGRKPTLVSFVPEAAFALGAVYDGLRLSLGLVDLGGRVHGQRVSNAPADFRALVGEVLPIEVRALLEDAGVDRDRVRGLGLGVPCVVDPVRRVFERASHVGLEEGEGYGSMIEGLEAVLGFPAVLENDANAAALGEFAARGGRSGGDLVFVELGRGLGAGLILDGKLRTGPRFCAGEIGYLALDGSWRGKAAEPGWLESRLDLAGFWREAEADGRSSAESIARVASLLAQGLAAICTALDVGLVVVGRVGADRIGLALLEQVRRELARLCPMRVSCEEPIAPEPGVSGAASLAMKIWLEGVFAG
jgi:predicted NBD/HSP70 family sugar kinase